jgi:polyisoprenoid-binding protein YceI
LSSKFKIMATTWKLDPAHSEIQFKVKHLMITTVTGYFTSFTAEAVSETDDFTGPARISFTADVASISTNNEQRDEHLKSADFFDAASHSQVSFTAETYNTSDEKITGNLTIKGITKPVTVNVEFGGIVVDPYGQTKAGFTISGKLSRKEYGLTFNAVTETGHVVVSDEVRLNAEIQLIKQA